MVAMLVASAALAAPVALEDGEAAGLALHSGVDLAATVASQGPDSEASTPAMATTPAAVVRAQTEDRSAGTESDAGSGPVSREREREREIEIEDGAAAAVPLPPSLWLLTPAVALLFMRRRRHAMQGA
jgi:hypothetical protein